MKPLEASKPSKMPIESLYKSSIEVTPSNPLVGGNALFPDHISGTERANETFGCRALIRLIREEPRREPRTGSARPAESHEV